MKLSDDKQRMLDEDGNLIAIYNEELDAFFKPRITTPPGFEGLGECYRLVCWYEPDPDDDSKAHKVCEAVYYDCPEA